MAHSISRRQFLQGSGAAALSVAAAGLLSSCGGSSASNGGSTGAAGSSSTYTVLYSRQPATLNYLVCSADPDLYHGTQCIDTLVEYDNRGKIREGLATAWEWDADSLTWTFHLRDENWVDCNGEVLGPVTAQDFVDALAYVLNPDYWGRGLASEAVRMVLKYGFLSLKLQRVEARCLKENGRSLRVMDRGGMQDEGALRCALFLRGEYRTVLICSALRDAYITPPPQND